MASVMASSSVHRLLALGLFIAVGLLDQVVAATEIINAADVLQPAASDQISLLTSTSHKIVASGWPNTSPLWPSIRRMEDNHGSSSNQSTTLWDQQATMEPFIYADKPRSVDYSLLLSLNETLIVILKNHLKPMSVNLSFEYYFAHDQKISALPGIKVEVDRKQFRYIEPVPMMARIWVKFNERITITDPNQFDNRDWLKFSLVNRQWPSLVAIRHLKVEFHMPNSTSDSNQVPIPAEPQPPFNQAVEPAAPQVPPANQNAPVLPLPVPAQVPVEAQTPNTLPPPTLYNTPTNPQVEQPASLPPLPPQQPAGNVDQVPAASHLISTTIKPSSKPSGWSIWNKIGRKKRDTTTDVILGNNNDNATLSNYIELTCFQSDRCDWEIDVGEQGPQQQQQQLQSIQWSLARMPPSTSAVQYGYYYVSNKNNYGDPSKWLSLALNETETATIADQSADHCIELALYVTERTQLRLYQLIKNSAGDGSWQRGNLLLTWSPTLASEQRRHLPKAKLASMEGQQNGWTFETLCYGDFFPDPRECAQGKCAFGFEMVTNVVEKHQLIIRPESEMAMGEKTTSATPALDSEQVVGIGLLREYSLNAPWKSIKAKWFETWQKNQVEPSDNWKFYPKMDVLMGSQNVTLLNLYDSANYYLKSDWLYVDQHLELTGAVTILLEGYQNSTELNLKSLINNDDSSSDHYTVFSLKLNTKLVDPNFNIINSHNLLSLDWDIRSNSTNYNLTLPISEQIKQTRNGELKRDLDSNLFKIILEFVLDTHWLAPNSSKLQALFADNDRLSYSLSLSNVSLSDRCNPSPCQFGSCHQNGTGLEDWNCQCDDKHRGRHCEFGRWCQLAHVTPWVGQGMAADGKLTLKTLSRQPKLTLESVTRVSGREYCQRKLGTGFKCSDIDLPLNDNLYTDEDKTFICSCQDDYYLSDDSKCRQAHLCNSVVCPNIGMICDETQPFNGSQPCRCNEKQDWFPDPQELTTKCVRRQCHDKLRDCGFEAHTCLPTLPGERPICKCGPKFSLKVNVRGEKYCQSTACVLPTLNDCQQMCVPDNTNLQRPFTCACYPGYLLQPDGRTCRLQRPQVPPHCRPACHPETQICTDAGCKCKQGYVGEGEVKIQQLTQQVNPKRPSPGSSSASNSTYYTQPIRCLNVCELTYAENKAEFELIESVCPLGLCDMNTFECRCSDPTSSALINTKYEPIYANSSATGGQEEEKQRFSPLCHLRRVCEQGSSSYKICKSQGAICVPDYTKAAMFDCICPPGTDKRLYGQETSSEFSCEPKCSAKKNECLRRQAVCKLVDKDEVKCDCLPGLMFNQHDQRCYLAKFSYAFNLIVVNRYYEPESRYHRLENQTTTMASLFEAPPEPISNSKNISHQQNSNELVDKTQLNEILPHYSQLPHSGLNLKSMFIAEYNQCNITQVIPKTVIEDPYEHDIESFLGYIDQCNEKIHQNVKTYHLNSKLSEDLRQSLRQHLRDFTVTTNNSSCTETDPSGMFLNCTIYLQSNEPIPTSTVDYVLNDCDKHGQNESYCWIKPRLLLKRPDPMEAIVVNNNGTQTSIAKQDLNYRQVVPCELDNFCGLDAYSVRLDDKTSYCSCKCPNDIEVVDVKDLEPRQHDDDLSRIPVKEICAPRNHCGANSTFCALKVGSVCHYDVRLGSRCNCVYPSYEDAGGKCIEITFSQLDNTLIVIIVMLGTGLIVSIAINLAVVAKRKSVFGHSKQYPLNEFPSSDSNNNNGRPINRSTGVPNLAFTND